MEKVRIGNDMRVNFSVYRNGEPESFDGASNIVTKLVNEAYNKLITHTYTIAGNIVQFDIDALQLTQCGKCRLFISYTKGGDYTVDSPAFELVNYTDQTGGTEIIGVEIVSINISGDIGINRDGLSAYEVWESYPGNEGKTIEQYFTWLRENPTKIDLDGLNSNINKLHFNPDTLIQLTNIGDVRYSPESRTLEVKVSDTVSIQLGQEMQTRVKNNAGEQINNGQMVYIDSAAGANPLAKIASTSNADIAQRTFGMATENIANNGFGAITTEGLVRDINTAAFPEGAMLWLGTNGSVTNIEPVAPISKISIGMVLRSNTNNGVIYVKIRAIARNQKLSDVYAPTLTGGDILRWNSTTLRFEVFNITTALSTKTDTSISVIAGNGLTGGGTFAADRTINVVNTDDSIVVAEDSIKVNTNNTLTSTSITQPLSANQGKVLNEKAVQLETDLNQLIYINNKAVNGGFDTNMDGWVNANCTSSVIDGSAHITASAQNGGIEQPASMVNGHKYYISAKINSATDHVKLSVSGAGQVSSVGGNILTNISSVFTWTAATANTWKLMVKDSRTTGYTEFIVDEVLLIDLTATFGAGNEPTKEQMEYMLLNIGYWVGNRNISNEYLNLFYKKADHGYSSTEKIKTLKEVESKFDASSSEKMDLTHRLLLVNPSGTNYDCLAGCEDAYSGGYTVECCSWDAFVINSYEWKNNVDVCVFFNLVIGQEVNATADQIASAMIEYKNVGVKFVFTNAYTLNIRKYSPNGTYVDVSIKTSILSGFGGVSVQSMSGGAFVHGNNYPFNEDIIRDGVTGPTGNVYSYTSTDPLVVYPVKAVLGETSINCTAYKPNAFFLQSYGGDIIGNAPAAPLYKYIKLNVVIDALLGKTTKARMALDCKLGKKIAASGFDGDTTTDIVAVKTLSEAIGKKRPLGLSLYATKLTPSLAGFYRGLKGWVTLVSHTNTHFNTRDTVVDEIHTIGTDQTITLYRPYRAQITSVKSEDGTITYNYSPTTWNVNTPAGINYFADVRTTSPIELDFGIIKFAVSEIGKKVKISYTCVQDEFKEILGSLDTLKSVGAITDNAVYLTGGINGTHPYTALMAERLGVTLCDHTSAPSNDKAKFYAFLRKDKFTIPVSSMFKFDASGVIRDTTLFTFTKSYNVNTLIPQAIAYCNKYDLPYQWYDHDFMSSETDVNGVWANATGRWNSDYKKATYEETRVYVGDMYKQLYDIVDAQNVVWMPREECVKRLDYINKHIIYDVKNENSTTKITILNNGGKEVEGLTFRIPINYQPTSVIRDKDRDIEYTYQNGVCLVWVNLPCGSTTIITVK